MTKPIPGKAIVKCKFEVAATLEVDIEDVYMMDRQILDVISYQGLFRDVDPYLPLDERTFGLDKPTMERLGIKVIDIMEYSDPSPTGKMRSVRDWEIEVDEEYYVAQTVKKTGEEK
jgi:hypothetical protein